MGKNPQSRRTSADVPAQTPLARRRTLQQQRQADEQERERIAALADDDRRVQRQRRERQPIVYDGETGAFIPARKGAQFTAKDVYGALGQEDPIDDEPGDEPDDESDDEFDDDASEDEEENWDPADELAGDTDFDDEPEDDEPDEGDVVYSTRATTRAGRAYLPQSRVVLSEIRGDDMPPPPPVGMPVEISDWINLGGANPQFNGWYIRCCLSVSLGVMRQAEKLSDEIRRANMQAKARGVKSKPRVRVEVVQDLLKDIVVDFNFVDRNRRPLPKPPAGLAELRGDLLITTFQAAMEALNVSKPNARRSTRR